MNKNEIRRQILLKRKNISNKKELSTKIVNKILSLDIYQKSQVIALYHSLPDEVDTTYILNERLKGKEILLPKIIDHEIVFVKVDNKTEFIKSNYGVLEPIGNVYVGNIDLIIVPGVAFDKDLNRMGFGMGYYDRYLCNKNMYKIGICFDKQIVDLLPHNDHDIKMNMVITENRVYK